MLNNTDMLKPRIEKSCGAVVYREEDGQILYLLERSREGFWGFPKGHMEQGETEIGTARREIKEETGLDVTFVEGFRAWDEHPLIRQGRPDAVKQVAYFLARFQGQTPVPQESEVSELSLMDYDSAMAVFQFESSRRILTEARDFLEK